MSALPLDDEAAGAVVDAMMPILGIPLDAAWRDAVLANVRATASAAALVFETPLDDAIEPAPVFRA